MVIFHSYVSLPEGIQFGFGFGSDQEKSSVIDQDDWALEDETPQGWGLMSSDDIWCTTLPCHKI